MIIYVLSWRFLSRKVAKIKIWASKNVAALRPTWELFVAAGLVDRMVEL